MVVASAMALFRGSSPLVLAKAGTQFFILFLALDSGLRGNERSLFLFL
jgi:hypothetical protein